MESASISEKHLADPILSWETQVDVNAANETEMKRTELLKFNEALLQRTAEILADVFLLHGPSLLGDLVPPAADHATASPTTAQTELVPSQCHCNASRASSRSEAAWSPGEAVWLLESHSANDGCEDLDNG